MQEKSQEPSAKRLKTAYLAGDTPFSQDLCNALLFSSVAVIFWFFSSHFFAKCASLFSLLLVQDPFEALHKAFWLTAPLLFGFCALIAFLLIIFHLTTRRWIFAPQRKQRIKEEKTFLFPLLFSCFKILFLLAVVAIFKTHFVLIALSTVLLGALDWFYKKRRWHQKMKMSKEEVKEEKRQSEGDPRIRSKFKETR